MPAKHNVFVYGTLLNGERNAHLLSNSRFVRESSMQYCALYDNGAYPILTAGVGTIYGELYLVTDAKLKQLDQLEGVPFTFRRIEEKLDTGETAWVYVGWPRMVTNLSLIQGGSWRQYQKKGNNHDSESVVSI